MAILRTAVLSGALCLTLAAPLPAQTAMAAVRGKIVDEQGAVLPGVLITIRSLETNLTRTVTTTEVGEYFLPNLPAGTYQLQATLDGFSPARREQLMLAVGQDATIDLTMRVGTLEQVVTIVGQGAVLETTQHTLGSVINSAQIDDLPTINRNFSDLAKLAPGVTTGVGGNGDTFSANGQRGYANGMFVDGASNEWNYYGSQASSFAQDWIQEFQVMTNSFAAEYGTASGGLLNVITRSGSNTFTGRAYGFFRDDALDAAPFAGFFENGEAQFEDEAPPLDQQRYGGFLGGPLMKDKLFFFTGIERLDASSSVILGLSDYWRNRGTTRFCRRAPRTRRTSSKATPRSIAGTECPSGTITRKSCRSATATRSTRLNAAKPSADRSTTSSAIGPARSRTPPSTSSACSGARTSRRLSARNPALAVRCNSRSGLRERSPAASILARTSAARSSRGSKGKRT